jgi:hypothetical protein
VTAPAARTIRFDWLPKQAAFIQSTAPELLYSGAFGAGKCVEEGTLVHLADGSRRRIEAIQPGDTVLALGPHGLLAPATVTARIDAGIRDGYRVTLYGGLSVVTSIEHPFFTAIGRRRRGNSRTRGVRVVPRSYGFVPLSTLRPQALVGVPGTPRPHEGHDCAPLSFYELLGYLLGDGALGSRRGTPAFTNSEPSVIARVRALLPDDVKLTRWRGSAGAAPTFGLSAKVPVPGIKRGRQPSSILAFLRAHGLAVGSHDKHIPGFVFTSSRAAIAALLSGLYVTDGWVDRRGLGYATVSERLARDVHYALQLLGVNAAFVRRTVAYKGRRVPAFGVTVQRLSDLERLAGLLTLGYKHGKLAGLVRRRLTEAKPLRGVNKRYRYGDLELCPIRAIEPVGPRQMYDLSVAEHQTFVGGGIMLHNTRALCGKALLLALRYPGTTIGLARRKLKDVKQTTLDVFLREVCPPELIVAHNKSAQTITLRSGPDGRQTSTLLYFGLVAANGESYNIRSLNLGACGVDEGVELSANEWDELAGRLRDPRCGLHQLFTATNPAGKGHFLYKRGYVTRAHGMQVIETNALENPHLPASYQARLALFVGRYRDRYVLGRWVDFEGLVYDQFDPLTHCLTWEEFATRVGITARDEQGRPRVPPTWTRVAGIDFGYVNPFVHQWWALSPDGEWFRYRELYHTRRIVADHAAQILRVEGGSGEKLARRYADHDAEDRATLLHAGISSVAANKSVSAGLQTVYELLNVDPQTGRPRMYFIRDTLLEADPYLLAEELPTCTEQELQTYAYPRGADGRPVKEQPVKTNDHGCDATRMAAHSHLRGGSSLGTLGFYREEAARVRQGGGG